MNNYSNIVYCKIDGRKTIGKSSVITNSSQIAALVIEDLSDNKLYIKKNFNIYGNVKIPKSKKYIEAEITNVYPISALLSDEEIEECIKEKDKISYLEGKASL